MTSDIVSWFSIYQLYSELSGVNALFTQRRFCSAPEICTDLTLLLHQIFQKRTVKISQIGIFILVLGRLKAYCVGKLVQTSVSCKGQGTSSTWIQWVIGTRDRDDIAPDIQTESHQFLLFDNQSNVLDENNYTRHQPYSWIWHFITATCVIVYLRDCHLSV